MNLGTRLATSLLALAAGSAAFAQDEMLQSVALGAEREQAEARARVEAVERPETDLVDVAATLPPRARRFALQLAEGGTFVLLAAGDLKLEVLINGLTILSSDGETEGEVRALLSMPAGSNVIEVRGPDAVLANILKIGRTGEEPRPLPAFTDELEPGETTPAEIAVTVPAASARGAAGGDQPIRLGRKSTESFQIGVRPSAGGAGTAPTATAAGPGMARGATSAMPAAAARGDNSAAPSRGNRGGGGGLVSLASSGRSGSSTGSGSNGAPQGGGSTGGGSQGMPVAGSGGAGSGNESTRGGSGGDSAGGPPVGTPVSGGTPTTPVPTTPTIPVPPTPGPSVPATVSLSPLSPPVDFVPMRAVDLVGADPAGTVVSLHGQTVFGAVMDPAAYDTISVAVQPSGRSAQIDVGPVTGQFAFRLYTGDFGPDGRAEVTLTASSTVSEEVSAAPVAFSFQASAAADGLTQALSRVAFGATPGLYARVRDIGFAAYVAEQLAPEAIADTAFTATDLAMLGDTETTSTTQFFENVFHENFAWAAYSERQLREVLGDFWWNHFHAINKDSRIVHQVLTDRRFFRDNAFAPFGDLLLYSARSPLMSQFLDNDESRAGRINENYGREVLELHTVGVDGGYGDADVIAVSRVFTGWRYEDVSPDAEPASDIHRRYAFRFQADRHDAEDKEIPFLSTTIAGRGGEAGVQEGEELIRILAQDSRTIAFVCGKLVERLVADEMPQTFVEACADAWASTSGDMREVVRAILTHPDFLTGRSADRSKTKNPFEYSVSLARAFEMRPPEGSNVRDYLRRFRNATWNGGYNSFRFPAPTGLPETGAAWASSGSMLGAYRATMDLAQARSRHNANLQDAVIAAGLETAEEVAAYLLAVATVDRYRREEFDRLVVELKGSDGLFEPRSGDETDAFDRAIAMIAVMPSFHLQ